MYVNTIQIPSQHIFLCNGGQHYVPYRWLLISNKLCDSTLFTCGGVGGEEQVHNVDYDPVKTVGGGVNRCIMLVMYLVNPPSPTVWTGS
jgi:hypothetical protein